MKVTKTIPIQSLSWLILAAGAVASGLALQTVGKLWAGTGSFLGSYSPKLALIMALVAGSGLLALAGLALSFTPWWPRLLATLDRLEGKAARLRALLPVLSGLLWLALPILLWIRPWNSLLLGGLYPRLWVVWLLSLAQLFLWRAWRPNWSPTALFSGGLLAYGLVFLLLSYRGNFSTSPFTLDWSEGSRYYNASLWFSSLVYGYRLPLPELHPTRYLMQGLAFLVPGATIAFHRAWQVFLWVACNGLAAWAVARRLRPLAGQPRRAMLLVLFGGWAFLSFYLGPVYYHLIFCAVLVLLGFNRAHFWRSLGIVLLASLWAGISRINWYPVPGALAVVLYLLEEPQGSRPFWRYLLPPAAWAAAGLGAAFAANAVYIQLSGDPPEVFGSALNSALLWYRLKPNPTYGPGVFFGSLVLLPVFLAAAWGVLRAGLRRWAWLRLVGLIAVLAVFYAGGIVVSLKVGGGSNLHNLDNFIVFLVVIAGYIFFERFTPDRPGAPLHIPSWALLVVAFIPVFAAVSGLNLNPPAAPQMSQTQALQWLQGMVDRYATDGRPVLLISERQLVTFNQLKVPAFEPAYEKVFLMEMAMSGNPFYLGNYEDDLRNRKFSLIISEPMNANIQEGRAFAEENNLWVKAIEEPTLARYTLVGKLDQQGYPIAVYAPKPK
jgi:hypothetical protein